MREELLLVSEPLVSPLLPLIQTTTDLNTVDEAKYLLRPDGVFVSYPWNLAMAH